MCWCWGNWAAVLAAAEGLFNDLRPDRRQAHRGAEMGRGAGSRRRWLDAFQRFVNKLPEGCELRVSNLEFQPLRTLARAGVAAARTPELLPRSSGRAG